MHFARFFLRLSVASLCLQLFPFVAPAKAQVSQAASPKSSTPEPRISCVVNHDPPSDAEKALSRRDYKAALELYQKLDTSSPDVSRAGVIRTYLREGKLQDAIDHAKQWQDAQPNSGLAMEIWGEVLFRQGELPNALKTVLDSLKLDPCNPRALLVTSRIEDLLGNHATAARQIKAAHMLAPLDVEIEGDWLDTLPRSQRLQKETELSNNKELLSEKDRKAFTESLAHAKDYKDSDCQLVQPVDKAEFHMEEIMYDANHRMGYGLYVKLNGKNRTLEIDSGASGIVLTRGAAARLGLVHEEKLTVGGVGDEGGVQSAIAHVESIRIGALEFKHCPITIMEKDSELDIDGLIGTDFFRKYLITLDFPTRKFSLAPLPKRPDDTTGDNVVVGDDQAPVFHDRYIAPEMADWSMVWRSGHEMFLPISIGAAKDKLFLVDTGAGLMSISPAAAREVTKVHGDTDVRVVGVSGEVNHVYKTQQFLVTFGQIRLHVANMTAMDMNDISTGQGMEISGFLGAPVLDRLSLQIDYRDNLVHMIYDPKKDPDQLHPSFY
jgi:predicted aspartyl protease